MRARRSVLVLTAAALLGGCSAGSDNPTAHSGSPAGTPSSSAPGSSPRTTYAVEEPTVWLCRPGMSKNPCEGDLDTTVVAADGSSHVERFEAPADPGFDCFYVYPTVSTASGLNAPKKVAPELVYVVRAQAALFQRVCRLYAPVYRQVTLDGLFSGGLTDATARGLAQRDVVDAFHDYLNRYNDSRPFLLIGHSQGAMVLTALIQTEVDSNPVLRSRLVSAMLLGGAPFLAPGSDTQGSFQNVPPCRTDTQSGCVVAYNTFQGKPPPTSLFGRTTDGRTIVCVNPAAPAGGRALLDPVVPVPSAVGRHDVAGFREYRDSVEGTCRAGPSFTWLDVHRADGSELPTVLTTNSRGPAWGLHRVDVTVALGDLLALAARQARSVG